MVSMSVQSTALTSPVKDETSASGHPSKLHVQPCIYNYVCMRNKPTTKSKACHQYTGNKSSNMKRHRKKQGAWPCASVYTWVS